MKSLRLFILIAGLGHIFLPSRAEVVIPLPIESLATNAQLIVRGTVLSTTVLRDPEGRIYTRVDLAIAEIWKGLLATNRFTIVHGGGVLGEERSEVSGQASYEVGEEVVTFLQFNSRGEGVSIGLAQGKFQVWQDPVTGESLAQNRFHGRQSLPTGLIAGPASPAHPIVPRLTVQELRQRVDGGAR